MRLRAILFLAMFFALVAAPAGAAERALVLDVDGVIGPAMADYIVRELRAASSGDVGIVVLRMNTPGGLDTSMREINTAILASPVPVATFVAPSGARAASAGTYIAYASAIAAMAPGTNIGAATPIQLGGNDIDDVKRERVGSRQADRGAYGVGRPIGIAAVHGGEAANISDGIVDYFTRFGVGFVVGFALRL